MMKGKHVRIAGAQLQFQFRGKSGQKHLAALTDRRLARIVKQCRDLPGYHCFNLSMRMARRIESIRGT